MTSIQTILSTLSPNDVVRFLMDQRRERFLYNIPQQRISIVTPYPYYSQKQLDMRRKVEILSYSANKTNSKTNNDTKKQTFSALAKSLGSGIRISQATLATINYPVPANKLTATPTSSCDVPGPIIMLQNDPNVPLYNYLARDDSAYSSTTTSDMSIFRMMTRNEMDFLFMKRFSIYPDTIGSPLSPTSYQVREESVGVIIISNNVINNSMYFNISTPVAIWVSGLTHMPNEDPADSFVQTPFQPVGELFIQNVQISTIVMKIYCNQVLVQSAPVDAAQIATFVPLNFNVSSTDRSFYAVQYTGLVSVKNVLLSVQAGDVYQVSLLINYTYIPKCAYLLRLFETGLFANVNVLNVQESVNCVLNYSPPPYSVGVFDFNPAPNLVIRHPNKIYVGN